MLSLSDPSGSTTSTVVLGKRKRHQQLVLQLSGAESGSDTHSENDNSYLSDQTTAIGAGPFASGSNEKKYSCDYEGCRKRFRKPSRLEEHSRSHTGERPYECETCKKTYLRDSHLQAHKRSHLDESKKPFTCAESDCDKRFWTAQHLKRHADLHRGERAFKCSEIDCESSFSKHSQLRAHFAYEHCSPGTKPFICRQPGCEKSFATTQKLKAHEKVHEENRYKCSHPVCMANGSATYFQNWTLLQAHTREVHRPTCPYSECGGRSFTQQKGLRSHLKIHEQRNEEERLRMLDGSDADDEGEIPKQRRRGGEIGREWKCSEASCLKDFKSKRALTNHINVSHLKKRDFVCSEDGCSAAFGYKHLLQRHAARIHVPLPTIPQNSIGVEPSPVMQGLHRGASTIDILTGRAYEARALHRLSRNGFSCNEASKHIQSTNPSDTSTHAGFSLLHCSFFFNRAYDFRRHLSSKHDMIIDKSQADAIVAVLRDGH